MTYIAVDLKVIEGRAASVARAAGASEDRVLAGLVRLWHRCWSQTTDTVTRSQLAGVMGPEGLDTLVDALCQEGFLETVGENPGWRVRGATRYLRLKAARVAGAAKTNAQRRSKAKESARSRASTSVAQASLPDALSPSTEHRIKESVPGKPAPVPEERETDAMCADFQAVTGSVYRWQGAKDGKAFADLRRTFPLAEIRARWVRGLKAPADTWASCRTVAQLASKWNDLALASRQTNNEEVLRML